MYPYAQVVIEFATVTSIDKFFTYKIPEALQGKVQVGARVKVPFGYGKNEKIGYVVALLSEIDETTYRLKSIQTLIDPHPLLSPTQLHMMQFLVDYYGATYAAAIDTVLPPGMTDKPLTYKPETVIYIAPAKSPEELFEYIRQHAHKKTFNGQQRVLEAVLETGQVRLETLYERFGKPLSALATLIKKGCLKKVVREQILEPSAIQQQAFKLLNEEQATAYRLISECLHRQTYQTFLLEGVTGSGKTEVFLHALRDVLEMGGSAIVLVPEIALTKQTLERFKERFGNRVALTHSRMTAKERQTIYFKALQGEISVVIGPRSAVFLPLQNLRLIILDEEHEATYKSEITPKYHAKAVAQMRMQQANGVVLLASATPSLESYEAAKRGEIGYLTLKNRIGKAKLPKVQLVDMREELRCGNPQVISRRLHQAMKETLESQQQVMLLLNRRGHSTFVNCRQCGHVMKCKHCDVALTYHHYNQKLKCHYCGIEQDVPKVCPSCQSPYIRFFGNGTEKVEAYLNEHFSAYGVGRMDFDTTSGKEGHHKILEAFRSGKINVLVGTQMIAKGHDFPKVTLVGIVAADMSLYLQDFRSGERTFQLLTQALGRSGRGENPGQVIIQTYDPDHMVLQRIAHHKQHLFYEEELKNRQMMGYPPYTHIFSLLVTGKTEKEVIHTTHLLYQYYQHYNKKGLFRLMGPVAATISKVADEYRWKITILGEDRAKLMLYGKYCLEKCLTHKEVGRVKIYWDIDPVGMI